MRLLLLQLLPELGRVHRACCSVAGPGTQEGRRLAQRARPQVADRRARPPPPSPPCLQTVPITHALANPMTVTWCNYNGTRTRDPVACSKLVGLM